MTAHCGVHVHWALLVAIVSHEIKFRVCLFVCFFMVVIITNFSYYFRQCDAKESLRRSGSAVGRIGVGGFQLLCVCIRSNGHRKNIHNGRCAREGRSHHCR